MADPARARKLAVRIREVVASALERGVKDPRLGMVTVTDVRVTPDLVDATVFYTVYGDEAARRASAEALESARGLLRSQVGRATGVKVTPTLTFVHDRLPDDAKHLEELISVARERDARLAEVRRDARPAGDDDPYRRPRTVEDELDDDLGDEFDEFDGLEAGDAPGGDTPGGDTRVREADAASDHTVYPASPGGDPTIGR
ncbi:30S ribosome-binding factor RbfA [Frankia sp. QA3]|uniref:30S ribosome-binding factor RbfA n=1 Tax=Frankia sp. QA3 TaxID=710111 RepID=UPI000269D018|nr:30S ribosome-binding factor RbfA [Frankia sp. QA3]EIV95970.1 ribosome-binding factor A [Frankia sp. QA3]